MLLIDTEAELRSGGSREDAKDVKYYLYLDMFYDRVEVYQMSAKLNPVASTPDKLLLSLADAKLLLLSQYRRLQKGAMFIY